ncbi:MAG: NADH-quinone oxidoreductase subunit NuoE [Desulfobacterota bacterium]|nr:NADH-quinone oxidoreductase subunit NuoE [Thermodesulfobacteriota bacterium]
MNTDTTTTYAGLEEFSPEQLAQVENIIAAYAGKTGSLIPVLEQVQEILGYLPMPVQMLIADRLKIPPAQVYGVVTFYSFFTMTPRGRHTIRVCLGTACYVRGSQKILMHLQERLEIEPGTCTSDRRFSLETVRCLGACGLAPVVMVDTETHGQMKPAKVDALLERYP